MTFNPTPEDQAAKLRSLNAATASAIGWGLSPDEVRQCVELAIAEGLQMEEDLRLARAGLPVPGYKPPELPDPAPGESATPALDRFVAQFRR